MSLSLERLARNQALFREVNERVLELAADAQNGAIDFLCECSNDDCTQTIEIRRDSYEAVRARPTWFVIAPGHDISEIENVVEEYENFVVVEKTVATEFVVETDPRSSGSGAT